MPTLETAPLILTNEGTQRSLTVWPIPASRKRWLQRLRDYLKFDSER